MGHPRFRFLLCLATWADLALAGNVESRLILQTSPLAGFQHHAGAVLFPFFAPGQPLALRREPDNPHDDKAVRVEWRGALIGYAPRAENVDLARLMDRGLAVEARILDVQRSRDPWKRVLMEIYVAEPAQPGPQANPGGKRGRDGLR